MNRFLALCLSIIIILNSFTTTVLASTIIKKTKIHQITTCEKYLNSNFEKYIECLNDEVFSSKHFLKLSVNKKNDIQSLLAISNILQENVDDQLLTSQMALKIWKEILDSPYKGKIKKEKLQKVLFQYLELTYLTAPLAPRVSGSSSKSLSVIDYQNNLYSRISNDCGQPGSQRGWRDTQPVLSVIDLRNAIIRNGNFQCSNQNTIWIRNSQNIVLDNVVSWHGSDNPLEIRDSVFIIVKNSIIGNSPSNKCIETENSIVFFYNVTVHDCLKAFAGERTSDVRPEIIFFINSSFSLRAKPESYDFFCDSKVDGKYGKIYVRALRRSSDNINCPIIRELPTGLIEAIEANDFVYLRQLVSNL